jgi:4'-phosphopantetheinyl transferase EntD
MDLTTLFPSNVVIIHATEEMWSTPVHIREEKLIEGSVRKRQREFRAGRNAARAALNQLGAPPGPLLRGENREPIWPQGFIGSISHCDDSCIAACTKEREIISIGLDVEPLKTLKSGIARYIETEDERHFMERHPELPPRLIFSAKESLYKCYYPLVRCFFGFHSVVLDIDIPRQRFQFCASIESEVDFPEDLIFHGHYLTTGSHLYTSCYLTLDCA